MGLFDQEPIAHIWVPVIILNSSENYIYMFDSAFSK